MGENLILWILKSTKQELEFQLDIEQEGLYILKGNWTEHFKMDKELSEMFGGTHWRAERVRKSMNEVRFMLDEQHKLIDKIKEKIAKFA